MSSRCRTCPISTPITHSPHRRYHQDRGDERLLSGAGSGEDWWILVNWVAHDINKRGGILVDGKRKKIQLIQGDTQGKPAIAKEVAERLCLEEKVHVLWDSAAISPWPSSRSRANIRSSS